MAQISVLSGAAQGLRAAFAPGIALRAMLVAVVVAPILTTINQWEAVAGGLDLDWTKVALTFLVPYLVSTVSQILALPSRNPEALIEPEAAEVALPRSKNQRPRSRLP